MKIHTSLYFKLCNLSCVCII